MNSTLITQEITKNYKDDGVVNPVIKDISIKFEQGNTYVIKGVSGSGKSTFLHMLGGLDRPTSGKILFNNQDLYELSGSKLSNFLNKSIGFIFQFHYLINELSVLENVMLMGIINGISFKESEKRARSLLELLGLENRLSYYPYKLSGGEQQRVSIVRA